MEILIYFSVLLTVFLGLLVGTIISFMAKEELKDGNKYFFVCKNLLLSFILVILLYNFVKINIYLSSLFFIVIFTFLTYIKVREFITYNLLAIVFYLSSMDIALFKIQSSLIFIYGIFSAGMFLEKNIKLNKLQLTKKIFVSYVWFLIIGAILFFI